MGNVSIEEALTLRSRIPIIDVRTPAEYKQGHIPGAINIPLFSDEERVVIGTLYKQEGKQTAILKGLEIVGPKMREIIEAAEKCAKTKEAIVHCWRGGMRSSSVSWLLNLYGFQVHTLRGGYKSFRRFVLASFSEKRKLFVIGGKTGSGKTQILNELQKRGEPIIDLELLAHHKGSSFGGIGEPEAPSQEHFENLLATALFNTKEYCWVEDESRLIGKRVIPQKLWENIRNSPVVYIDIPASERIKFLVTDYGKFSADELKSATLRIGKRLGGQHVKAALAAIDSGDLPTACKINLAYYDKTYGYGLSKRKTDTIHTLAFDKLNISVIAEAIIKWKQSN